MKGDVFSNHDLWKGANANGFKRPGMLLKTLWHTQHSFPPRIIQLKMSTVLSLRNTISWCFCKRKSDQFAAFVSFRSTGKTFRLLLYSWPKETHKSTQRFWSSFRLDQREKASSTSFQLLPQPQTPPLLCIISVVCMFTSNLSGLPPFSCGDIGIRPPPGRPMYPSAPLSAGGQIRLLGHRGLRSQDSKLCAPAQVCFLC